MPPPPTKRQQQSDSTRRTLVRVARRLFAKRGYEGTAIEDILTRAKVARGALYHHFPGKKEIFRAVFEQLEEELAQKVAAAAAAESDPDRALEAGLNAFLDACLEPEAQQIALIDAPAVLGWQTWYEIDAEHSLGLLMAALQASMDAGRIEPQPVEPLGHVLLGAFNQAALSIARADDVAAARETMGRTLQRLLDGLKTA